jgi:hypothetical protein
MPKILSIVVTVSDEKVQSSDLRLGFRVWGLGFRV